MAEHVPIHYSYSRSFLGNCIRLHLVHTRWARALHLRQCSHSLDTSPTCAQCHHTGLHCSCHVVANSAYRTASNANTSQEHWPESESTDAVHGWSDGVHVPLNVSSPHHFCCLGGLFHILYTTAPRPLRLPMCYVWWDGTLYVGMLAHGDWFTGNV